LKEDFLIAKLDERRNAESLRQLRLPKGQVDFCSNDYLGVVKNKLIEMATSLGQKSFSHGSTGSRLLAGNYALIEETERMLAVFHQAEAALIFNSGYDANLGLLSSVPRRGDTIIYDYLVHASIRDGMRLSFAQSLSFAHNDCEDLEKKLQHAAGNIFVVTESVFSMDGDQAPLAEIVELCRKYQAHLIVDEAHATGVIGKRGEALAQSLGLQQDCFARIYTFGKALGCHGAAVLGSQELHDYLINFSRPFIYSTSLPETAIAAIGTSYQIFPNMVHEREYLGSLIDKFQKARIAYNRLSGNTPIQVVIIPGNEKVKQVADKLQANGLDVRPILYPTVPKGSERLRIVLHSFNTSTELDKLIFLLSSPVQ
jgi:8-amino-7-oxononanoate synthase